jgi:hypothetical protein
LGLGHLDQYCSIVIDQVMFVAAVFDAFAAWDADLVVIGYQHDLDGALKQLPKVDQAVQAASRPAARPHIPTQIVNLRTVLASEVANCEALLRAVKAGDTRTALPRLAGFEPTAVENVNDKAVAAFESLLFAPLYDRYVTSIRAAAFAVTGAV